MISNTGDGQTLSAKRAESKRPFHGDSILRDEKLSSMHRERALAILADLKRLMEEKVSFSPFLEVGAGSVQRSAALMNHYPAEGVATDISQNSLHDTPFVLSLLNYDRVPMLICCDAHQLPFLANTFRFVFCFQTLHHFSNPIPVIRECRRVLGTNGFFYFSEEPMDSALRRLLRGKRVLSDPPTRLQRFGYRLGVEKVFWDDGALERSLGITEARFDMGLWRKALQPFGTISIEVNRRLKFRSNLHKPILNAFLSGLIGGNVRALCLKTDGEPVTGNFRERLVCLDCNSTHLSQFEATLLRCEMCGRRYPITDGVIRMLPKELEAQLYPETSGGLHA